MKNFFSEIFSPINESNVKQYEIELQKLYKNRLNSKDGDSAYILKLLFVKAKCAKVLRKDKTGEHKIIIE